MKSEHMKILEKLLLVKEIVVYATGILLNYSHFKENLKLKSVDLHKQEPFNVDLKEIQ